MSIYKSMRKRLVAAGTAAVIMTGVAAPGAFAEEMRFDDVSGHYIASVEYLSANDIVNGKTETHFGTILNITRGETALIIARALELDTENAPDAGFTDATGRYKGAVNALYEKKIIDGVSKTEFNTGGNLTRGQMAKILVNAYNIPDATKDSPFTDGGAFDNYIDALSESEIAKGKSDTLFGTNQNITRGEFAKLLFNAIQKTANEIPQPLVTGIPEDGMATEPIIMVKVEGVEGYSVSVKLNGTAIKKSENGSYPLYLAEGENKIMVTAADASGKKAEVEKIVSYDSACDYDPTSTVNPDRQTINCLITEVVRENGNKIPPEIVKAVAEKESAWTQFLDGKPLVRTEKDGREGIGIMQITNTAGYDVDRLKYDIKYNIETGVKFLMKNFYDRSDLPKINDHDPTDLESWYFAIMAYNGTVQANSPVKQATGERNTGAYQELVYDLLEKENVYEVLPNIDKLDMKPEEFEYNPDLGARIKFLKTSYELEGSLLTPSNQLYEIGDIVHYEGSGLRLVPATLGDKIPVTSNDELKIIGKPVQDNRLAITNHYVWYPVMKVSTGEIGYIASNYIK